MLSFLSCLESGILPYGKFDPPLFMKKRGNLRSKRSSKFAAKNKDRINNEDYSGLLKELSSDKGTDGLMNFVFRITTSNESKKTSESQLCLQLIYNLLYLSLQNYLHIGKR